jgi:hypothetical protein
MILLQSREVEVGGGGVAKVDSADDKGEKKKGIAEGELKLGRRRAEKRKKEMDALERTAWKLKQITACNGYKQTPTGLYSVTSQNLFSRSPA